MAGLFVRREDRQRLMFVVLPFDMDSRTDADLHSLWSAELRDHARPLSSISTSSTV